MAKSPDPHELAKTFGFPLSAMDEDLLRTRLQALSEHDNIPDAVAALTTFSILARGCGLLHLERFIHDIGDPLLRTLLQLVVDGTDPELVTKIADNRIAAALERRGKYLDVIRQGILSVQSGDNPRIVSEILHSITGNNPPGWARQTTAATDPRSGEVLSQDEIDALLNAISGSEVAGDQTGESASLFEMILSLADRDLQQVIREIDERELALAMRSVPKEVRAKIFRNISKRAAAIFKENMVYMGPVRFRDVLDAQHRIMMIIRKLEHQGEIVVPVPPKADG